MFSLRTYFCRICPCPAPNAALSSTAPHPRSVSQPSHARAREQKTPDGPLFPDHANEPLAKIDSACEPVVVIDAKHSASRNVQSSRSGPRKFRFHVEVSFETLHRHPAPVICQEDEWRRGMFSSAVSDVRNDLCVTPGAALYEASGIPLLVLTSAAFTRFFVVVALARKTSSYIARRFDGGILRPCLLCAPLW